MNKTTKVLGKVIGRSVPWGIITTSCAVSMLTVGAVVAPAQAATLCFCYEVKGGEGASSSYNGSWTFSVDLLDPNKIKLTVKGSNSPSGNRFNNRMYTYDVTEENGKYTFSGTNNRLTISGMFTPSTNTLVINSPITSTSSNGKEIPFDIKSCPEPTFTLSLLALGTLGAASTLKRKQK